MNTHFLLLAGFRGDNLKTQVLLERCLTCQISSCFLAAWNKGFCPEGDKYFEVLPCCSFLGFHRDIDNISDI